MGTSDAESESGGTRPRLPRKVVLLGWVSFFADVSGEMVYPLIPLFVVGVLGASAVTLGTIEGAAQLMVALVTAWAGWRSDKRRRRVPFVRVGYGLPVIGKALLALAFAWPMVLVGRVVDRFGKGLRGSPRDALIADAAGPELRGRAFGFHRAMDTAGAMIGVLMAAGLVWWLTGTPAAGQAQSAQGEGWVYRTAFGIAAALGLVSLAITFFVRESERAPERANERAAPVEGRLGLPASYWRAVALMLVFALANSSDAFLLLRAHQVGLSAWAVVLAYALFNLTYTLLSYPAGVVSDRMGRWRVVGLGWAIYGAAYVGFAFTNAAGVWALFPLYGVYMALTDGVGKALVSDHAPRERRGTALGIYSMASGVATLGASVVAGVLWERVGPWAPFGFGAVMAGVAVGLVPVLRPRVGDAT